MKTFEIPIHRIPYLNRRLAELQKRADRLKLGISIGYREVERRTVKAWSPTYERTIETVVADVEVYGDAPKLQGWSLVCRLDYTILPDKPLYMCVPGKTCPPQFAEAESTRCDACGHKRARNDLFVIRHENGEEKIVGRSCLKDFLGHVSPEHVAEMARLLSEVDSCNDFEEGEFWGGGRYDPEEWDLEEVIVLANFSIRTEGWYPSSSDTATKGDVIFLLTPRKPGKDEDCRQERLSKVSDRDWEVFPKIRQWIEEQPEDHGYISNLKLIFDGGIVSRKTMGFAVSAIIAYDKELKKRKEKEEKNEIMPPEGRVKVSGVVMSMKMSFTDYGDIMKMLVECGNGDGTYRLWGTVPKALEDEGLQVGDKVEFTAKVSPKEVGFGFYSRPTKALKMDA